jgi:hypothetical protein
LDQALTTLRLTWRWRGQYLRALVLPLVLMAGLPLVEWYTDAIADMQYVVGLRFFHDPHSLTAQFLVRNAVNVLYAAAPVVATATILSTIAMQPAATRWLPERQALPLVAALTIFVVAGDTIVSFVRRAALRHLFDFGPDWTQRNESMISQIYLVAYHVDFVSPAAAVLAIIVARAVFATAAARTARPTIERVVNAALLVLVLCSALSLANDVLKVPLLAGQTEASSRPLAINLAVLATDLTTVVLTTVLFATAVAVASFAGPTEARAT